MHYIYTLYILKRYLRLKTPSTTYTFVLRHLAETCRNHGLMVSNAFTKTKQAPLLQGVFIWQNSGWIIGKLT